MMAKGMLNIGQRQILTEAMGDGDAGALERVLDQFAKFCRLDHTEIRGLMAGTHRVVLIKGEPAEKVKRTKKVPEGQLS